MEVDPPCRAEGAIGVSAHGHPQTLGGRGRILNAGVRGERVHARLRAAYSLEMGQEVVAIRVIERSPVRERAGGRIVIHEVGMREGIVLVCKVVDGAKTVSAADGVTGAA